MNVIQLQKQLEMLPDQSLATYMQRPDGTVPQYLVLSELNRRKKLRDSAASMAQGPAPSTTVKQDLEQGIGALPAAAPQAPEAYAAGGLVSFARGGDVDEGSGFFRYAYGAPTQFTPEQMQMIAAQRAAQAADVQNRAMQNTEMYEGPGVVNAQGAAMGVYPTLMTQAKRAREARAAVPPSSDVSGALSANTATPDYSAAPGEAPQIDYYDAQPLVAPGYSARAAGQTPQGIAAVAKTPVPAAAPTGGGGLRSLAVSGRTKTAGKAPAGAAGPDDTQYKPISTEDRLKEVEKLDDYFKNKNAGEFDEAKQRLADARDELAARKQDNINQALIQAGLGIMAGKSQYALTNIGEGAQSGLAYLQKANAADDAAKKALISEQNALTAAQASARRGDQQSAIAFQGQAEKDRQFAVTAAQQRENYLLAHQDRQAQINATLQAASMRVSQGSGTKQDMLALKAAQMAEGSAKAWASANKNNPEYFINPQKFQQDYQQQLSEGYTRAYAVIGREMPDAIQQPAAAPKATMQWDPKAKKLVPIQ